MQNILSTDTELMLFAYCFCTKPCSAKNPFLMKADALDKHLARKRERDAARGDSSE